MTGEPLDEHEYRVLLRAARAAPSVHNSQPWSFPLRGDRVEVWVDDHRALPRSDPGGRQRVISCGAATFNLRLAMERLGFRSETTICPPGPDERHVATVARGPARPATPESATLFDAVASRRTNRDRHRPDPVNRAVTYRLRRAALDEGAILHEARTPEQRAVLLSALRHAIDRELADGALREEFDAWLRDGDSPAVGGGRPVGDGMPVAAWTRAPYPTLATRTAPSLSPGDHVALTRMVQRETFFLLVTPGDDRPSWMRAGMALQRVLLVAHRAGLAVDFLNEPVGMPPVRDLLPAALGTSGAAQQLLRVGYPWTAAPVTPRRRVEDVAGR